MGSDPADPLAIVPSVTSPAERAPTQRVAPPLYGVTIPPLHPHPHSLRRLAAVCRICLIRGKAAAPVGSPEIIHPPRTGST